MPHRYVTLPFAATRFGEGRWPCLDVAQQHLTARIDFVRGEIVTRPGGLGPIALAGASGLTGARADVTRGQSGPVTTLSDERGWSLAMSGELYDAWSDGALIVLLLALPGHGLTAAALVHGQLGPPLRVPAGGRAHLAGPVAVCLELGCVHCFERDDDGVRCLSLPAPGAWARDARVGEGHVVILGADHALDVDLAEVPRTGPHTAASLCATRVHHAGVSDDVPAVVAFVFEARMLVDHPTRGRLTVPRDESSPAIERGEHILLEDIREDLPGVVKVHAWRKAGEPRVQPDSAPLELEAPGVRPMSEEEAAASRAAAYVRRLADELCALAEEHGFRAPPLLVRILREREEDGTFAELLERCGLAYFDLRGLTADWDADPCLLAFAGTGGGDEIALYLYPPACDPGREPPVVEFFHETRFAHHAATTFDAFFDALLARSQDREAEKSVRERLGFRAGGRAVGEAPDYLPREDRVPDDPERALVRRLLLGDADALDALHDLYDERGWSYPLASIAAAIV